MKPPTLEYAPSSRLHTTARSVLIVANPKSGASSGVNQAEKLAGELCNRGFEAEVRTELGELKRSIDGLSEADRLYAVVAAGGDGTAALIANLIDPQTPLALLPLGTENLLARHLGLKADVEFAADVIERGTYCDFDAGDANGKLFLLHATVGFDAEVVRQLHQNRTGHISQWSYFKPIFRSLRKYRFPLLRITTANDRRPVKARWSFVFNLPCYAMGLPILADADGCDGMLDLCTFRGGHLINGLKYFVGVIFRRHRSWRDTHLERTTTVRIEADEEVPFQLDGDPGGSLPLEIRVIPNRVRLIVP